jgi:hypothetical protein
MRKKARHTIEVMPARKYYGPHATGHVLLVDWQVVMHAPLAEIRKSGLRPKNTA